MLPSQLQADNFSSYPHDGRHLAEVHLALFRQLPLAFLPFLLKEVMNYDFKFPIERKELNAQLTYLEKMNVETLTQEMAAFGGLKLIPGLAEVDWVNSPGRFLEEISAHIWATHQMDVFRSASEEYMGKFYAQLPSNPLPMHRLGIAVIGQGVASTKYPLFRKLRGQGSYFRKVSRKGAWPAIVATTLDRVKRNPGPYAHWYIDGGPQQIETNRGMTCISYEALAPVRSRIAERMRAAYESPTFGAEALRTALARMNPSDVGMDGSGADPILDRFQLSLFTEGSGTQIYSTTFVQWAAREAYRRAQPLTLVAHFAPRVREHPMDELLSSQVPLELDPQGSLIDADMGAYYTWLDQQRLPGAATAAFLVWFEDHEEAVAVGREFPRGGEGSDPIEMSFILERLDQGSP